jgi:hypothetical protein
MQEPTIYNYTLVAKIHSPAWIRWIYYGIPWALVVVEFIRYDQWPILSIATGFVIVQLLHYWLIHIHTSVRKDPPLKHWSFLYRGFWIGFLPEKTFPYQRLWFLHIQLLLIGTAFIAVWYPWLKGLAWLNVMFIHGWLLVPRFLILLRLYRKHRSGLIRINPMDTSFYSQ